LSNQRGLALRSHRDPVRLNSGLPRRADLARVGGVPLLRPEIAGRRASQRDWYSSAARRKDGASLTVCPSSAATAQRLLLAEVSPRKHPQPPTIDKASLTRGAIGYRGLRGPGADPLRMTHLRGDVPGSPIAVRGEAQLAVTCLGSFPNSCIRGSGQRQALGRATKRGHRLGERCRRSWPFMDRRAACVTGPGVSLRRWLVSAALANFSSRATPRGMSADPVRRRPGQPLGRPCRARHGKGSRLSSGAGGLSLCMESEVATSERLASASRRLRKWGP
jgi:hypothetical protein